MTYNLKADWGKWDTIIQQPPITKKVRRDAKVKWSRVVQRQVKGVKWKQMEQDVESALLEPAAIDDLADQMEKKDRPVRFLVTVSPNCNGYETIENHLLDLMKVDKAYMEKSNFCSQIKIENFGVEKATYSAEHQKSAETPCHYIVSLPLTLKRCLRAQNSDPNFMYKLSSALESRQDIEEVFPDLPFANQVTALQASIPGCTVDEDLAPTNFDWAIKAVKFDPDNITETGDGVRIGQVDSGCTRHPQLNVRENYDLANAWNTVEDNSNPFEKINFFNRSSHGTATGSIISSEHEVERARHVTGIAPNSKILPVRAFDWLPVSHWFSVDITQAFKHLVGKEVDIITMSLGGILPDQAKTHLQDFYESNVILCAASGNCVSNVVEPANYPFVIACGGMGKHKTEDRFHIWTGSATEPAVDIFAPAENVHVANWENRKARILPSQGTSFAAPHVAGAAALWIEHHGGREHLISQLAPDQKLTDLFRQALQETAYEPNGWDASRFGAGVLNIEGLLNWSLPSV